MREPVLSEAEGRHDEDRLRIVLFLASVVLLPEGTGESHRRRGSSCLMIDLDYDGEVFDIDLSDVPELKDDLVQGRSELDAPNGETTVGAKITDMRGEELLVTWDV